MTIQERVAQERVADDPERERSNVFCRAASYRRNSPKRGRARECRQAAQRAGRPEEPLGQLV